MLLPVTAPVTSTSTMPPFLIVEVFSLFYLMAGLESTGIQCRVFNPGSTFKVNFGCHSQQKVFNFKHSTRITMISMKVRHRIAYRGLEAPHHRKKITNNKI